MKEVENKNPWGFFNNIQIATSDGKAIVARFMLETDSGVFVEEGGIRVFYPFANILKIVQILQ